MKKKGFTLIELLAVIVILAIIALIATPIVMNVIENSKKGAAERSAENYLKAVETAVGTERIDGVIMAGEYTINSDGNLVKDGKTIKIEMSGNKPSSGTIFIENGKVVEKLTEGTEKTSLAFPDYTVDYNDDGKLEATKNGESSESNLKVVYRWSKERVNVGDELSSFTYVENLSELGKGYYLKHVVENNIVTESYACSILDGVSVCGRGGNSSYYIENLEILKGLDTSNISCSFEAGTMPSSCNDGAFIIEVDQNGGVISSNAAPIGSCFVYPDGISYCGGFEFN